MTGHMRVAITKTVFFTTHARLVEGTANVSGGNSPEIPLPRQEGGYLLDGCKIYSRRDGASPQDWYP